MNKIDKVFENKKALIGFLTAGDPNLETTEKMILSMAEAGMDMIEIGLPFSDPITETESMQKANIRALANGCTTDKVFDMMERVRSKCDIPVIFMTYINPIFTYGKERFLQKCASCGISGLNIPDLPYEERGEIEEECHKYNVARLSTIVPSKMERIREVAGHAEGFLCGMDLVDDRERILPVLHQVSKLPCVADLGNASYEEAAEAAASFDGVIVGGAVETLVEKYGENCISHAADYVRMMKKAVEQAAA